MQKVRLGNSDIYVSKICLGSMTWGQQNNEDDAHAQLDYARDHGINFVDTAEMYPVPPLEKTQGLTEQYIGSWITKRGARDQLVLATKVAGPAEWLPHLRGGPRLNAEHINKALNDSLTRLNTDYVDLYQLHWPERATNYFGQLGYEHKENDDSIPLLETLECIKALLESGKIRAYGLSNETPWGLMSCISIAQKLGMPSPVSVQNPYNLLNRVYEVGMAECSHRENVGLLAYSPLAFGVLSGKYMNGARPSGARITLFDRFTRYTHGRADSAVADYAALAQGYDLSLVELSLGFVTSRSFVTSNIIGATSMAQLEENIRTIDVTIGEELMSELEALHLLHTYPCP